MKTAYERLGYKQKMFFDNYVKHRAINRTAKELEWNTGFTYKVFAMPALQAALKEYNESLADGAMYNTAVIVDKLWSEYADDTTPKNVKVQILVWLGKHIGMWASGQVALDKAKAQSNVTYNVVNYNIENAIEENREEVEKVKDTTTLDTPEGILIADYSETVQ